MTLNNHVFDVTVRHVFSVIIGMPNISGICILNMNNIVCPILFAIKTKMNENYEKFCNIFYFCRGLAFHNISSLMHLSSMYMCVCMFALYSSVFANAKLPKILNNPIYFDFVFFLSSFFGLSTWVLQNQQFHDCCNYTFHIFTVTMESRDLPPFRFSPLFFFFLLLSGWCRGFPKSFLLYILGVDRNFEPFQFRHFRAKHLP